MSKSKGAVEYKGNKVMLVGQDHSETFSINLKKKRPITATLQPYVTQEVPDEILDLIKHKFPVGGKIRQSLDGNANEANPHGLHQAPIKRSERQQGGPIIVGEAMEQG